MKNLDFELLSEALNLLAELTAGQPPQHWVACGGSSLLALGLVNRPTIRDVDVAVLKALDHEPLIEEI